MPPVKLITKDQWDRLIPRIQGYACYMQGSLPGSELKDVTCPYPIDSREAKEFAAGELNAMMDTQDSEE
jgi:hypothetical protein